MTKLNVTENLKPVLGRVESIAGKAENADYQHFLLFPTMFSKDAFFQGRFAVLSLNLHSLLLCTFLAKIILKLQYVGCFQLRSLRAMR